MRIRRGTFEDLDSCVEIAEEFWNQLSFSKMIPFNATDCLDMFTNCLMAGLVAVAEEDEQVVGVVAGLASPCTANFEYRFGADLIWYVKKGFRKGGVGLRLLKQIESQAKEVGIVRWSTMVFDQHDPEVGGNILEQHGYVPTERAFSKVLK